MIKNGSGPGIKQVYYFNILGNNKSYIKLGILPTVSTTGGGTSKVMFTVKGGINFGGTNESVYEVAASTRGSIKVTSTLVRGNRELKFGYVSTSSNVEIWMAYDGTFRGVTEVEVSSSVNFTLAMTETTTKPSGFVEGSYRILAAIADNVASATKLQTPRIIWGQSFDGTGNVNGTIYINNNDSTNGAILLNNDKNSHARISAIDDKVIFNTSNAIRFGETDWDWNKWAGLKYNHSNKTIYLGIADGSVFHANSVQSNGTLNLPNITTITTNGTLRIGENLKGLYLGNSNNNSWVFVQDMCSQNGSGNWCIYQNGSAKFKNTTIDGTLNISSKTIINDSLDVKGLITNQGILPANSGFNNKGANCIVSADALCSGLTAITDSIPVDKVTIQYSNNNGSSWNNLNITNDNKFKMYTNSAGINTIYLGNNFISGSTNAEKLAQVKKNELMFSFYFPDNCYSQIYFACVDISNGVNTTCTVEIVRENGEIADKYTKEMFGWNKFNYINFASTDGNDYLSAGTSYRRVVRFRFKHNQNITESRNACINKIRIFAFTKYSFPTDRFMGHTGHIYNFDYNMNTYFPNSVVAKGGVTAYQSSDIRLKTNINKLNCLNVIKSIGGTYEFDYIRDHKHSIGFIAQNINNPLLKDIVAKDDDGYLKINYWNPKLISLAFGALTQIDDEVNKLKARVTYLESEVERLNNENKLLISK